MLIQGRYFYCEKLKMKECNFIYIYFEYSDLSDLWGLLCRTDLSWFFARFATLPYEINLAEHRFGYSFGVLRM